MAPVVCFLSGEPRQGRFGVGWSTLAKRDGPPASSPSLLIAGVDEALVRAAARRIGAASSVAFFEDLGVQMSLHSTLSSYLEKLLWLLTGNFAIPGAQYAPTSLVNLAGGAVSGGDQAHR